MVSLIETLAMMIILQGALLALTHGSTITSLPDGYYWIGQFTLFGWPVMPLVFVAALAAEIVFLRRTTLGRSVYAVGGNLHAAEAAGIRARQIKVLAFAISGFLASVAGYLLASWQMAIHLEPGRGLPALRDRSPDHRGVSVFGGRGHVPGISVACSSSP